MRGPIFRPAFVAFVLVMVFAMGFFSGKIVQQTSQYTHAAPHSTFEVQTWASQPQLHRPSPSLSPPQQQARHRPLSATVPVLRVQRESEPAAAAPLPTARDSKDARVLDEWKRQEPQLPAQVYGVPRIPPSQQCLPLLGMDVQPGVTWGKLPQYQHSAWSQHACDVWEVEKLYNDHIDKTNARADAKAYLLHQQSLERQISARLNGCIAEGSCPWIHPSNKRPVTVVVARWQEDIAWLSQLERERFDVALYSRLGSRDNDPSSEHYVPHNFGEEAAIFLHYILQHYDTANFSEHTAFVHAHDYSWHQRERSVAAKLRGFQYGLYPFQELQWRDYRCMPPRRDVRPELGAAQEGQVREWEQWFEDVFLPLSEPGLPWKQGDAEWPAGKDAAKERQRTIKHLRTVPPIPPERVAPTPKAHKRWLARKAAKGQTNFNSSTLADPAPPKAGSKAALFGGAFGRLVCNHCCAQFVVHRSRILAQPKQLYQETYDLFWNAPKQWNILESAWHLLFGELPQVTLMPVCQYHKEEKC